MTETLLKFKNLEIDKALLKKEIGDDLFNVDCPKPLTVTKEDLCEVIQCYMNNDITLQQLVDWVNVIWLTGLFEIPECESDSVVSVLEVLETLDEEGVAVTENDFFKMLRALSNNIMF